MTDNPSPTNRQTDDGEVVLLCVAVYTGGTKITHMYDAVNKWTVDCDIIWTLLSGLEEKKTTNTGNYR